MREENHLVAFLGQEGIDLRLLLDRFLIPGVLLHVQSAVHPLIAQRVKGEIALHPVGDGKLIVQKKRCVGALGQQRGG